MRILILTVLFSASLVYDAGTAFGGQASYYTEESVRREGNSGVMANGEVFDEDAFTCAMWDKPFGTLVRVTNIENGRSVVVELTDRGPAKRLVKKGRIIDLSKAAFERIAGLRDGLVPVRVEEVEK